MIIIKQPFHSDDLLKHMVGLLMNTMDVQSLIEIALANPVPEDFNRKNPLNYAKRDFERSWYHTRTAKTISLDESDKKIVDLLVKKFTQSEIADKVGLSQSAVSRRLKKIAALGKEFEKNFSINA